MKAALVSQLRLIDKANSIPGKNDELKKRPIGLLQIHHPLRVQFVVRSIKNIVHRLISSRRGQCANCRNASPSFVMKL